LRRHSHGRRAHRKRDGTIPRGTEILLEVSLHSISINDIGAVAGYSYTADNVATHAFVYKQGGKMTDLARSS